jgi:hypothetical protein
MWLLLFSAIFMLGALLWLRRRMELLQKLPALLAERIAL